MRVVGKFEQYVGEQRGANEEEEGRHRMNMENMLRTMQGRQKGNKEMWQKCEEQAIFMSAKGSAGISFVHAVQITYCKS